MFENTLTFNIKLCRIASLNRSRIEQSREIFLETLEEYFYELSQKKLELLKELELNIDISNNIQPKNQKSCKFTQ